MNDREQIGLYGKLPAYGDFLVRNLDSVFVNAWDEWLQHYVSGSREQIGENWLDVYLTSPIWRFVLSDGVIDDRVWAGLMMPSVDRVGRYFPVSLVKPLTTSVSPVNLIARQGTWFHRLELHCLEALDGKLDVDELVAASSEVDFNGQEPYEPTLHLGEAGSMVIGLQSDEDDALDCALPYVLNARLSADLSSFSLWRTTGSELIAPVVFCCQGLPSIGSLPSMLDGQWQERNWKIPYNPQPNAG